MSLSDYLLNQVREAAERPTLEQFRERLARRSAAYVALAEALEAPLLTCDRKLSRASGVRARVELI
jgi:hypothetical protein